MSTVFGIDIDMISKGRSDFVCYYFMHNCYCDYIIQQILPSLLAIKTILQKLYIASQEGKESHVSCIQNNVENVARLLKHMSISKLKFERNDLSIYRNNV